MQNSKFQVKQIESDNLTDDFVANIENKVNKLTEISCITGVISIISFFMVILSFPERSNSNTSSSGFFMGVSVFVGFITSLMGITFGLQAMYKSNDLNHLDNTNISRKNIFLALALNLAPLAIFLVGVSFIAVIIGSIC